MYALILKYVCKNLVVLVGPVQFVDNSRKPYKYRENCDFEKLKACWLLLDKNWKTFFDVDKFNQCVLNCL